MLMTRSSGGQSLAKHQARVLFMDTTTGCLSVPCTRGHGEGSQRRASRLPSGAPPSRLPTHTCRLLSPSRPALGLDDPSIPIPFFPSVTDDCLVPALSRSHPRLAPLSVVPQDASVSPEDAPTLRSNDPGPPRTVRSPSASPPWPPPPGARLPRVRPSWRSRGQPGPAPPKRRGFRGEDAWE